MAEQAALSVREQLYRAPHGEPELVRVPEMGFVMIDGRGDPNTSPRYQDAIQALYALSYALSALKRDEGLQYRVGPLEGLCAQVLHIGPFDAEGPTIAALHAFIRARGFDFDGRHQKHHEIYLSDPRRSAPERWKTILRQPVAERSTGPTP